MPRLVVCTGAVVAVLCGLGAPVIAGARSPDPLAHSPDLWATVNICNTRANPGVIGIRGSMPGLGRRAVLWMRFQVQYLAKADNRWHNVEQNADSGMQKVGTTGNRVLESGWSFKFLPPPNGGAHTLRGAVTFVWKRNDHVVRRARRVTTGGHDSTQGADPPGYSADTCVIS